MKKIFLLFLACALSLPAFAGFIVTDWKTFGDGELTYVEELGIEILDVTNTSISHTEATAQIGHGGMFEGFRFMNSSELDIVLTMIAEEHYYWNELTPAEKERAKAFLVMIGVDNDSYINVNTCEHAYGCNVINYSGFHVLEDGYRSSIGTDLIMFKNDNAEVETQLLVRRSPMAISTASLLGSVKTIPEPSSMALMLVGIVLITMRRKPTYLSKTR